MSEAAAAAGRWLPVPVPLPAVGRACAFELEGHRLLLCNAEGVAYVIENRCPHVRVPLAGGVLQGAILECPLHGGRLDVRDGSPVELPIRKHVATFPLRCEASEGARLEVGLPAAS